MSCSPARLGLCFGGGNDYSLQTPPAGRPDAARERAGRMAGRKKTQAEAVTPAKRRSIAGGDYLAIMADRFPRLDPALAELTMWLIQLSRHTQWSLLELMRRYDADHSVFAALLVLGMADRRLPMQSVARRVAYSSGGFSNAVSRMVRDGLVVREEDAADRRLVYLRITPAGERLLDRVLAEYEQHLDWRLRGATAAQRRALLKSIRLLMEAFRAAPPPVELLDGPAGNGPARKGPAHTARPAARTRKPRSAGAA